MEDLNLSTSGQAVLILGMHRSGTSALTGSLQNAGLYLGETSNWNQFNHKGNRENRDFVNLNERILVTNDGAWDTPPKATIEWNDRQNRRAQELTSTFKTSKIWGFKDPRTLLLLSGWQKHLPNAKYVGIYRNPEAVALSLKKRNHIPLEKGMAIWSHYNKAMIDAHRIKAFPIMCFDLNQDTFLEKIKLIQKEIGLDNIQQNNDFFSSKLINHRAKEPIPLAKETKNILDELNDIAF